MRFRLVKVTAKVRMPKTLPTGIVKTPGDRRAHTSGEGIN